MHHIQKYSMLSIVEKPLTVIQSHVIYLFVALFLCAPMVHAADLYFVGDTDSDWNDANNWSFTSGGAGGDGVPGGADRSVMDINSPNCTVDVGFIPRVDAFLATANFAATFDLNGQTLRIEKDAEFLGGTFTHSNGKVVFLSAAHLYLTNSAAWRLYDVEFNKSGFNIYLNGGVLYVDHDLLWTKSGAVNDGSIELKGDLSLRDINVKGTAVLKMVGGANQTVDANGGSGMIMNIEINNPGNTIVFKDTILVYKSYVHVAGTEDWLTFGASLTFDLGVQKAWTPGADDYNNVTIDGGFNLILGGSGTIKGLLYLKNMGSLNGSYDLNVHGDVKLEDSNVTGTATVKFVGSGAQKVYIDEAGGTGSVNRITIDKPSGTLTLKDNIVVKIRWTWTRGDVDAGSSTVIFDGNGGLTLTTDTVAFNNVVLNTTSYITNIIGTLIIDGTFTITSVSKIDGGTVECRGDIVAVDTILAGTASFNFTGTANQTITAGAGIDFPYGLWTVNKTLGKVTLLTDLKLDGSGQDLTVIDGELDLNGFNLSVTDQFTVTDGLTLKGNETITVTGMTIDNTASTVTYKDAAVIVTMDALTQSYYNLTLGAGKTHEVTSGVGNGISVAGDFASNGTSGNRSVLRSLSDAAIDWELNLSGTSSLADKVDVKRSNAAAGNRVAAAGSVDSGNTTNWFFVPTIIYSGIAFTEAVANNGTVPTTHTISLVADQFTPGPFVANTHYTVANVPPGMTLVVNRDSAIQVTLSLTGTATNHKNIHSVTNMTINFLDAAFNLFPVASVVGSDRSDLSVTFTDPPNSAPTVVADAYRVTQNETLSVQAPGVLSNDSDVDGHSITAHVVGLPQQGTLTFSANGSFIYYPNAGFAGADSFTYVANDGSLNSVAATVSLTIDAQDPAAKPPVDGGAPDGNDSTQVNRLPILISAPTATPGEGYVGENITFSTVWSDADGDTLQYIWIWGDGSNTGYTPNSDQTHAYAAPGSYAVTLSVTDGQAIVTQSLVINILAYDMQIQKTKVNVSSDGSRVGKDKITAKGLIVFPVGFVPEEFEQNGVQAVINFGGVESKALTLNYKGSPGKSISLRDAGGQFKFGWRLKTKEGATNAATISIRLTGSDYASILKENGYLVNEANPSITLPVTLRLGARLYHANLPIELGTTKFVSSSSRYGFLWKLAK